MIDRSQFADSGQKAVPGAIRAARSAAKRWRLPGATCAAGLQSGPLQTEPQCRRCPPHRRPRHAARNGPAAVRACCLPLLDAKDGKVTQEQLVEISLDRLETPDRNAVRRWFLDRQWHKEEHPKQVPSVQQLLGFEVGLARREPFAAYPESAWKPGAGSQAVSGLTCLADQGQGRHFIFIEPFPAAACGGETEKWPRPRGGPRIKNK